MGTSKKRFIELHGEAAWDAEYKKRQARISKFYSEHPERKKEYQNKYYLSNIDSIKEYQKGHNQTKERRASRLCYDYKKEDNLKNMDGSNITQTWILERIFSSSCTYCGDTDWRHLGCDRIDNNLPHTQENCVCACWDCNNDRQKKGMSVEEYIKYKKEGN